MQAESLSCQLLALLAHDLLTKFICPIHPLWSLVCRDNCVGDNGAAVIIDSLGPSRRHILNLLPAVINTPDLYEYKPIVQGAHLTNHLEFEVDASNDAHVRLLLKDGGEFEVVIGGWNNTQSVLRTSTQGPPVSQPFNGSVLAAGEFKR